MKQAMNEFNLFVIANHEVLKQSPTSRDRHGLSASR